MASAYAQYSFIVALTNAIIMFWKIKDVISAFTDIIPKDTQQCLPKITGLKLFLCSYCKTCSFQNTKSFNWAIWAIPALMSTELCSSCSLLTNVLLKSENVTSQRLKNKLCLIMVKLLRKMVFLILSKLLTFRFSCFFKSFMSLKKNNDRKKPEDKLCYFCTILY